MRAAPLVALAALLCGCSDSPVLKVDVDLAVNQTGNPLARIEADRKVGASAGVRFRLTALNCPPAHIDDVSGAQTLDDPPLDASGAYLPGHKANSGRYDIDASTLYRWTYYRVEMIETLAGPGSPPRYYGVADCPVNFDRPGEAGATICFGYYNDLRICPDVLPWRECAVSDAHCR